MNRWRGNKSFSVFYRYIVKKRIEMLTKKKVLETLNLLPDNFTIDELLERLIILHKVETGLQQVKEGKTLTTDEKKRNYLTNILMKDTIKKCGRIFNKRVSCSVYIPYVSQRE